MNAEMKERIKMINKGGIPTGYKKTKVGIIPEDWEVKKLGEIANVLRGASPRPINDSRWFDDESYVGWVRISDVSKSNKVLVKTEQYLSSKGIEKSRLVYKNNIIMSICATVGKPIFTGIDVCIHDGFVVFNGLCIDKFFFYYLLLAKEDCWSKYGQVGSQMNLNTNIVGNEKVVIPKSRQEQQKIAHILSTWDNAIELKEKLIVSKKEQKKVLMQNLLTGKVRLPGFDGEWKEVRLGGICIIKKGEQLNREHLTDKGNYYALNGGINPSGYTDDWNTPKNTISISEGGESCGYIRFNYERFWSGGHCYTLHELSNKINSFFLYQMLKNKEKEIMELRVGSGLPNIQLKELKKFLIKLPSTPEQQAIANILSTADKEIELLNEEIDMLKEQKKGLMQLLLTGIVRVQV
ncbi:MAG: restriction endonuclease subunit S [Bacilli bacterium]|nr:restriction endonuclease subunit S [Bacilli bacterium]